jgi:DNA-directed RNA polymerase subunit K/omega
LAYESDEEEDDESFKKLKSFGEKDILLAAHPESVSRNFDEIASLSKVVRNAKNQIIDPLHRMDPYLSKFEKARVLGVRTLQLQSGSQPFVKLAKPIMDSTLIAQMELDQKVLPFIIQRPDPNGGFEYWEVRDLEIIC